MATLCSLTANSACHRAWRPAKACGPRHLGIRPPKPFMYPRRSPSPAPSPRPSRPPQSGLPFQPRATASPSADPSQAPSGTASASSLTLPRMLTVAGSDSGAGAGIQADLKAAAARGVWCSTVVAALTAQNSVGVQGVLPTPPDFVAQQMRSILTDIGADAVKTGMLPTSAVIEAVCSTLLDLAPGVPLVVDPVLVATSGDALSQGSALVTLRQELLPLATVVTPNLREAEALLGLEHGSIRDVDSMRQAGARLVEAGARAVLVKGGHLPTSDSAVDVFFDGVQFHEFRATRLATTNTHGTGCTLASAIAAELAAGKTLLAAVQAAKDYLGWVLQCSAGLHLGDSQGKQGPLCHLPSLVPHPSPSSPTYASWGPPSAPAGETPPGWRRTPQPVVPWAPWDPYQYLRLYAVTDSRMNTQWGRSIGEAVQAAVEGGATIIQIREKDQDTGDFVEAVSAALKVTRQLGIPLVVNDRVDVALACDADGVHVGQSDMPASMVRKVLGPYKILGVSAKTAQQAEKAAEDGADYVGVGGVFPTTTKEDNKTIGVDGLLEVCRGSPIPVVAIGGINAENAASVLVDGRPPQLAGVAVVSALFNQRDIVKATQGLRKIVDAVL